MTEHVTKEMKKKRERRERSHLRIRQRVRGSAERPRLSVYKSLKFIYAQVIDDDRGCTIAAASSADPDIRQQLEGKAASNQKAAKLWSASDDSALSKWAIRSREPSLLLTGRIGKAPKRSKRSEPEFFTYVHTL